MNCLKLFSRCSPDNLTLKHIINRKILNYLNIPLCCNSTLGKFLVELEENTDLVHKIIYNEVLRAKSERKPKVSRRYKPLCLKYILEEENKVPENAVKDDEKPVTVHFPYKAQNIVQEEVKESVLLEKMLPQAFSEFTPSENEMRIKSQWNSILKSSSFRYLENPSRWIEPLEVDVSEGKFKFGSYNPHKAPSSVPCGGCGAFLHCSDPSIPGFIPAEIFENASKEDLQGEKCQRCVFLKELDVALGVNVKASEYSKIISAIKEKEALVILMIDMLDAPCSIYPGILDLIGEKPVIIVGNKVDLLIKEGFWHVNHIKKALKSLLKQQNMMLKNVKNISLISAKTGYGVEDLINVIIKNWDYQGDIYLVGCTNAGKSTLFNTLLQSDFCRVHAEDLLQRATISAWPGTTLNLLKFPIARPTQSRMIARYMRLRYQKKEMAALEKVQGVNENLKLEQIPLKGHVMRSQKQETPMKESIEGDDLDCTRRRGLNPGDPIYQRAKWFYDTPGTVHDDQIVNLLTTSELLLTVPKKMLLPRNFRLEPGLSLFIGGLARLDYINGPGQAWFTVFASMELPLTVTKLEDADDVYEKLLGTPLFVVPMKGKERLAKWPKLSSKKLEIEGKLPVDYLKRSFKTRKDFNLQATADVVLSSAGWITITLPAATSCMVEAWTPEGRGIHVREVPLIMTAHAFKGQKISGSPAFRVEMKEVEMYPLTGPRPFEM